MRYFYTLVVFAIVLKDLSFNVDAFTFFQSISPQLNQLNDVSFAPHKDIDFDTIHESDSSIQYLRDSDTGKSLYSLERRGRRPILVTWTLDALRGIQEPFTKQMHEDAVRAALDYENDHDPPLDQNKMPDLWISAVIRTPFHRTTKPGELRMEGEYLDHKMHMLVLAKALCGYLKNFHINTNKRAYDDRPGRQFYRPYGSPVLPRLTTSLPPKAQLHLSPQKYSSLGSPYSLLKKVSHPPSGGDKALHLPHKQLLMLPVKEIPPLPPMTALSSPFKGLTHLSMSDKAQFQPQRTSISQPLGKPLDPSHVRLPFPPPWRPNPRPAPIHPPYIPRGYAPYIPRGYAPYIPRGYAPYIPRGYAPMTMIHGYLPSGSIPVMQLGFRQSQLGPNPWIHDPNFWSTPSRGRYNKSTRTWIRGSSFPPGNPLPVPKIPDSMHQSQPIPPQRPP